MREQTEECKHTQRVSEVKVESVKQSVVQSSSQSGIFTRSKDLGERHLVFTTFLTSAWRGGRRLRRDGGGGGEVRDRGEGAEQKDVMTTTNNNRSRRLTW